MLGRIGLRFDTWDPRLSCPDTHFRCEGSDLCMPAFVICNGVYDCPHHQDEVGCESYVCPGYYRCRGSKVCLHPQHVCDGVYQCPEKDDELFCNVMCPESCTCYGLAFACRQPFPAGLYRKARYLDAKSSGMRPTDLVNNTMLVYLSLAHCRLKHLHNLTFRNLVILDVSHNDIDRISIHQLSSLLNMRTLALTENPLTSQVILNDSPVSPSSSKTLSFLDLSKANVTEVSSAMFRSFPGIEHLNLSHNPLTSISDGAFVPLRNLRTLDIRKCPLVQFLRDVFGEQSKLQTVFADNYKLCCPATLPVGFNPKQCQAPADEVSSCDALLQSDLFRVVLSIAAFCGLFGNVFSFAARVIGFRRTDTSSFAFFIIHLCMSDFLMGVYLAIVGVADRVYMDSYIWEEVSWRHSTVCQLAGFLSLLSSETSAILICLVTLDRLMALRFPFSSVRFGPKSATAVCISVWFACCLLASVPLANTHWHFYSQTGICIPLPITRLEFPGHDYAFGLVIVFNFVLFLLIASGQISIYLSIRANQMTVGQTTRKSQDAKIAGHLITVAVSDFLCWFPIGLLGLLASQGAAIPGVINVTMAIVVLPLNSALNPFLYNLNLLLEKRRAAREKDLMRKLTAELDEEMSRN